MTRSLRRVVEQRSRRGRRAGDAHEPAGGQGGYVLLAVLAAIAITSLTIGALFGLMLTTIRVTAAQERAAKESRAADGAVVSAINNVRLHQTDPLDACTPGVPTAGLVVPFPGVDGTVKVTCAAAPDQLGPSGGDIALVGDGYKGTITDWRTAWPWPSVPVSAATLAATDPSLVHTGDGPLPFNGNLTSNKGIAAVRSAAGATPAVNVRAGAALQPVAGLGGTGTSCGVLAGTDAKPQAAVIATSGVTCGDASLAPVLADQNYGTDPTVPRLTGCGAGAVVDLQPGTYDRDMVATLNSWFNGSIASCKGKTFHFNPGIYSFDANARTGAADDKFALIFNDPTATFVFGTANGWGSGGATAANFPRACVPGAPGASIVISARTQFRHLAGRLAVCPYTSAQGRAWPALLQSRSVPTAVTVNTPTSTDFTNIDPGLLSGSSTNAASRVFGCSVQLFQTACDSPASFSVKLMTAATGPVTSLPLRITGDEPNYNVTYMKGRTTAFDITLSNGATCAVPASPGAPDDGRNVTWDVMAAAGTCDTTVTDAAQLDGATVKVTMTYSYALVIACFDGNGCWIPNVQTSTIWQVGAALNTWQGAGDAASTSPPTDWSALDDVLVDDSAVAYAQICPDAPDTWCPTAYTPSSTRSFQMTGIRNLPSPAMQMSPTAAVDSIGVTVRQRIPGSWGQPPQVLSTLAGQTTVTVTLTDGTVCSRSVPGVSNMPGDTYYPLMDNGSVNCGGATLSAAQLTGANLLGASVQLTFRVDCIGGTPGGNCLYIEPVPFQFAALNATSNTYTGPVTQAQFNVDAASGKSANFFGPAYLPHTALDIFWKGTASNASIFGGDVQLYSLGSRMTAGATADVVCCTAPSSDVRRMVLTAEVDGRKRTSATISINRTTGVLEVLSWVRCGRNGDCAVTP